MRFRRFSAGTFAYGTCTDGANEESDLQSEQIGEYENEPSPPNASEGSFGIPNVAFSDPFFKTHFSSPAQSNYACIERMLLNIALNHAVVVEGKTPEPMSVSGRPSSPGSLTSNNFNGNPLLNPSTAGSGLTDISRKYSKNTNLDPMVYNASSPDELALVNGARFLGVKYAGRDDSDESKFKISIKG